MPKLIRTTAGKACRTTGGKVLSAKTCCDSPPPPPNPEVCPCRGQADGFPVCPSSWMIDLNVVADGVRRYFPVDGGGERSYAVYGNLTGRFCIPDIAIGTAVRQPASAPNGTGFGGTVLWARDIPFGTVVNWDEAGDFWFETPLSVNVAIAWGHDADIPADGIRVFLTSADTLPLPASDEPYEVRFNLIDTFPQFASATQTDYDGSASPTTLTLTPGVMRPPGSVAAAATTLEPCCETDDVPTCEEMADRQVIVLSHHSGFYFVKNLEKSGGSWTGGEFGWDVELTCVDGVKTLSVTKGAESWTMVNDGSGWTITGGTNDGRIDVVYLADAYIRDFNSGAACADPLTMTITGTTGGLLDSIEDVDQDGDNLAWVDSLFSNTHSIFGAGGGALGYWDATYRHDGTDTTDIILRAVQFPAPHCPEGVLFWYPVYNEADASIPTLTVTA